MMDTSIHTVCSCDRASPRESAYLCQLSFGQPSLGFAPLESRQARDVALEVTASETLTAPGKLEGERKAELLPCDSLNRQGVKQVNLIKWPVGVLILKNHFKIN